MNMHVFESSFLTHANTIVRTMKFDYIIIHGIIIASEKVTKKAPYLVMIIPHAGYMYHLSFNLYVDIRQNGCVFECGIDTL